MPITGWLNHPVFAEDGSLQSSSTSQGRAFFFVMRAVLVMNTSKTTNTLW